MTLKKLFKINETLKQKNRKNQIFFKKRKEKNVQNLKNLYE